MTGVGNFDFVGRTCLGIRRAYHQWRGQRDRSVGPIEFSWDDGSHTTIDANADWTLYLSPSPWVDSFSSAPEEEQKALEAELGRWVPEVVASGEPLAVVIGRQITAGEPLFDEDGDLSGLRLTFGATVVVARVFGGEIVAEVVE